MLTDNGYYGCKLYLQVYWRHSISVSHFRLIKLLQKFQGYYSRRIC